MIELDDQLHNIWIPKKGREGDKPKINIQGGPYKGVGKEIIR